MAAAGERAAVWAERHGGHRLGVTDESGDAGPGGHVPELHRAVRAAAGEQARCADGDE